VIDGDEEQNKNPQPHTEADEFIEVLYAPVEGLLGFLEGLFFCFYRFWVEMILRIS